MVGGGASGADRLAKLAEDSAAGQVADGLARPQEQAKRDIASAAGATSRHRGQVGKAIAEDMEILEQDVFGKGSVFDPHPGPCRADRTPPSGESSAG